MKSYIMTLLISMTPVLELRGAIPYGAANGMDIWVASVISVLGNMIPIPFILVFIRSIFHWMKRKNSFLNGLAESFEKRAEGKKDKVIKYEFWGLVLLVAIPLPGTGAWTGAMVAAMLDMQLKRAVPAILAGVIIAGLVVGLTTAGVVATIG